MSSNFKWDLKDNSPAMREKIMAAAERAITAAAEHMVGEIADRAPGKGALSQQISKTIENKDGNVSAKVGSPTKYAIYVEYGTGEFAENGAGRKGGWAYKDEKGEWHFTYGMKPTKFMRSAFRENKQNIQNIIADEMRKV